MVIADDQIPADLAYRLARRNAHNADAALSTTLANMLMEPGHFRKEADVGFRFLVLSHTLLSYLSGLGAHRETQLAPTRYVGKPIKTDGSTGYQRDRITGVITRCVATA